jgi:imidazolonepropionase-like amidohydrolase
MQEGKLGTIAAGACADLLIADGDPHLGVLLDPDKNLKFVMKDGIIYKNELN